MTLVELEVAVADATKGTNLLEKSGYHKSKYNRRLKWIALTGSAAAEDTEVIIKYGSVEMGRMTNVKTGLVIAKEDMRPHSSLMYCPYNEDMSVEVSTPPGTNPIKLFCDIQEIPGKTY